MKKTLPAVLLSALVFPGTGHLYLKKPVPGYSLIAVVIIGIVIIVRKLTAQANTIAQQLMNEGGSISTSRIVELAIETSKNSNNTATTIAMMAILACWFFGIIDSYRLSKISDQSLATK